MLFNMLYFIFSLRTSLFPRALLFSSHISILTSLCMFHQVLFVFFFVLHVIEIKFFTVFLYFSAAIVIDTRLNKAKKCLLWNIFSVVQTGIFEAFFVLMLLLLNIFTHRKDKYNRDSLILCSYYLSLFFYKNVCLAKISFHYLIYFVFCRVMEQTKTSVLIVLCWVCWSA